MALASATGPVVMRQTMKAELSEAIGEKSAGIPAQERVGSGCANSKGSVVFGGRHVSIERPRGRR